ERWGVGPEQIPEVMALMGDSIDNIPGVKGIGEKTAVKLIAQYGSVDKLYDNLTLIAGKLRETLALGRKQALLSRELALVNRHVPRIDALGVFHPDVGAAGAPLGAEAFAAAFPAGAPVLGGRPLTAHDAKPLLAAWMDAGVPPPTVDDTAVAAYLLNPARATYRLDEVCMEVFGECPAALTSVAAGDLPRAVGDRARWPHRLWEHARK